MGGTKVWLAIDLALRSRDNRIEIVDWKTGTYEDPEDIDLQLAVYALYAARNWLSPLTTSQPVWSASLNPIKESKYRMDGGQLQWVQGYIIRSTEQMKSLLIDPDSNIAREDDFHLTANSPALPVMQLPSRMQSRRD